MTSGEFALGANGAPNARAETGGTGTGPRSAAPRPTEPSDPLGDAGASHCINPDLPRGGNAAGQLNPVKNERSTSRINSAAAYPKANRNLSAMAAGRHGDHAPASVELGRNCGRSGTDDCESGQQSEGAHTIANHGSPHTCVVLLVNSRCPGGPVETLKLGSLPKITTDLLRCSDHRLLELPR
jgi:hypothetical protein